MLSREPLCLDVTTVGQVQLLENPLMHKLGHEKSIIV